MQRAEQTSFFYLLLALACFDQSRRVRHGATLRSIGRDYMTKATKVTSKFDLEPARVGLMNEVA